MRTIACDFVLSLVVVSVTLGCGSSTSEIAIDRDKALEVMRTVILSEPALFDRKEYNPPAASVQESWIDPYIQLGIEQRNFGRWPTTEREASRLAFSLKESAWRRVLEDPLGRELFEQQMHSYWENPRVELSSQGDSVEMNLGVAPGPIQLNSRGYYSIPKSEYEKDAGLIASELVRRLNALQKSYPSSTRWRVTVIVLPDIERQHPITYEYRLTEDRLFVYTHQETYYSPAPLERNIERLLTGESPIHPRNMKLLSKDRVGKPFVLDGR